MIETIQYCFMFICRLELADELTQQQQQQQHWQQQQQQAVSAP
jgi:hypothetical protein